ncbi:MAG: hypothetical protein NC132_05360 [Corallococcus sp.]|nr:hypothetical protein [Corallococcus sp.]MCM1359966.1 hypothetical protein [Corallococcus sp.]MCM1395522.1 hypothetical protein [Corallococcus sp.]
MMEKNIYAITKAEFLNKSFNTQYKKFSQTFWKHPDGATVWMFYDDGQAHDNWKVYCNGDKNNRAICRP